MKRHKRHHLVVAFAIAATNAATHCGADGRAVSGDSIDDVHDARKSARSERLCHEMKRKSAASAVEFLPRRFFFVTLRDTERLQLRNTRAPGQSTTRSIGANCLTLPAAAPGVRFVSLDDYVAQTRSPTADLNEAVQFHAFLACYLADANRIPSSERSSDTSTAESTIAAAAATTQNSARASVFYFYLRQATAESDAHVIHLICQWRLVHLGLTPHEAAAPFEHIASLFPAMLRREDRCVVPSLPNLLVSLTGIASGLAAELLGAGSVADVMQRIAEQQRALNDAEVDVRAAWVTKRLLVLYELHATAADDAAPPTTSPAPPAVATRLTSLLKQQHVTLLLRLGVHTSADSDRASHGIEVVDLAMYAPAAAHDCAVDASDALARFLDACESASGVTAVLSSFGSSQTAAFVGCYLMKHERLTAREAFAWTHWCCADGATHEHQLYLDRLQLRMWRDGDALRQRAEAADDAAASMPASNDALHISVGNMSLTRHSLFGTKGDKQQQNNRMTARGQASTSREPQRSLNGAMATAHPQPQPPPHQQVKRRPLTQGSIARRPRGQSYYRNGESGSMLRPDFAQMHKFLHQTSNAAVSVTTTPRSASPHEPVLSAATVSSADVLPPIHTRETPR